MTRALTWMPALCAAVFPIHPRATTPLLGLWAMLLLWTALTRPPKRAEQHPPPILWWGGLVYYLFIALGLLWTEALAVGLFALEVKMSLWLLPLLFFFTERHVQWNKQRCIDALWIGLLVAGAFGLAKAGWYSITVGDHSGWSYAELAGPLHPTYLAWYWAFGWFAWLAKKRTSLIWWMGSLFAGLMLGLLASKAGWLAGAGIMLWNLFRRERRLAVVFGASGLILGGALFGQSRATELLNGISSAESHASEALAIGSTSKAVGSTGGRLQAWEAAYQVLLRNPFGVGTGDVETELVNQYQLSAATYAAAHGMNAHNAYLEAGVAFGWLGMILLLVWWGSMAWKAFRTNHELAFAFAVLALWFACTESILELQSGVVWIAFGSWTWGIRASE